MEALAIGLKEVVQEEYLRQRIGQVEFLGRQLQQAGVPVQSPLAAMPCLWMWAASCLRCRKRSIRPMPLRWRCT